MGPALFRLVAVFLAASVGIAVAAEQTQDSSALIVGQVVDASTGRGIAAAIVTLAGGAGPAVSPLALAPPGRRLIADTNGQFVYRNLVAGRYTLSAARPGYRIGFYGRLVPRGLAAELELAAGERMTTARILMWRESAIAGRVVDEAGEPVVGAEVRVQRSALAGRTAFQNIGGAFTDDLGMYRIFALDPGTYRVVVPSTSTSIPASLLDEFTRATGDARAELQQALFQAAPTMTSAGGAANMQVGNHIVQVLQRMPAAPPPAAAGVETLAVYPTLFYPSVSRAEQATLIKLGAGETRANVDVRLRPVSGVTVSGRIEARDGPAGIATLFLMRPSADGDPADSFADATATTVADASGAFTFHGVPPGDYVLIAVKLPHVNERVVQSTVVQTPTGTAARGVVAEAGPSPGGPSLWAIQRVSAGSRGLTDLRVVVDRGFRVAGRVVAEGGALPPRTSLYIESAAEWLRTFSEPEATTAPDGAFTLPAMPAGRYRIVVPLPSAWFVKSIVAGGRDLTQLPFDLDRDLSDVVVTISTRGAGVSGVVRDRSGKPDPSAGVMIFPADPREWVVLSAYQRGLKEARAGRDGLFVLGQLPAGDYFLVAAPQAAFDWSSPDLLPRLSRVATRVTLSEAEQKTLDLRVVEVR